MLVGEPRQCYYIYPSCCCFRYSFDELRTVLADPVGCSALSQGVSYYRSFGYPLDIQPFDMLPSEHGERRRADELPVRCSDDLSCRLTAWGGANSLCGDWAVTCGGRVANGWR